LIARLFYGSQAPGFRVAGTSNSWKTRCRWPNGAKNAKEDELAVSKQVSGVNKYQGFDAHAFEYRTLTWLHFLYAV
jgi:hypothetical protein